MSSLPTYRHMALANQNRCRLLQMQVNNLDEPLKGDILECTIGHMPSYMCLSYAWGANREVNQTLEIRGQNLPITAVVSNALRWIRAWKTGQTSVLIWIDAVCISQIDKRERAEQVLHMKQVFTDAELVLVYLGEASDGSQWIPEFYKKTYTVYDNWKKSSGRSSEDWVCKSGGRRMGDQQSVPPSSLVSTNLDRTGGGTGTEAPFRLRNWGFDGSGLIMPWHVMFHAALPVITDTPEQLNAGEAKEEAKALHQILLMLDLGMGEDQKRTPPLVELLQQCRHALATDPRDYIYGVMGLTSELYRDKITIDYQEPVADTYRRVARTIVHLGDGAKLLYNVHDSDPELGLPSWIPDWSSHNTPLFALCPTPTNVVTTIDIPYVCAGGLAAEMSVGVGDKLICKGYLIDVINSLSALDVDDEIHSQPSSGRDASSEVEVDAFRRRRGNLLSRCFAEMSDLLKVRSAYKTDQHEDTIWRTSIWNRAITSQKKAPGSYVGIYRRFISSVRFEGLSRTETIDEVRPLSAALDKELGFIVPGEVMSKILVQNNREDQEASERFASWAITICAMMRRGSTAKGYLGQVPKSAEVGDIICVIAGAAIPFTLRRVNSREYRLIGQCYLHGFMEGEALADSSLQETEIVLI